MARIRSLKPEHPQNRKIGKLSDRAYRVWVTCVCQADDEGRRLWDPDEIRALIYAYQPRVSKTQVEAAMQELRGGGLATVYEIQGRTYYELHDWHDHQRIDHATPSLIPPPNGTGSLIREDSRGLASVRPDRKGGDLEGKGPEGTERSVPEVPAPAPAPAVPENLQQWLKQTMYLSPLADARHAGLWAALDRAYDQYGWLYFSDEIAKADAWIAANPSRRPTVRGLPRFMRNWLDKAVQIGRRKYA